MSPARTSNTAGADASEQLYRIAFQEAPVGIVVNDMQGRTTEVNPAFLAMFGLTRTAVGEKNLADLVHPESLPMVLETMRRIREGRDEVPSQTLRYVRADGSDFFGRTDVSVVRTKSEGASIIAMISDVSEQVAARASLRQSEERLTFHLEQTMFGIIEWDRELRVQGWNRAAELIFGYSEAETLGRTARELIGLPSEAEEYDELLQKLLDEDRPLSGSNNNRTKDGREIVVEWQTNWVHDEQGQKLRLISLCRDVTEQTRNRELLEDSEARLRTIVEAIPVPIAIESLERDRFLFANRPYADLAGLDLASLRALETSRLLLSAEENAQIRDELRSSEVVTLHDVKGAVDDRQLRLTVTMREVDYGGERALLAAVTDLTELRRAQQELAKVAAVVDASGDFIAIVDPASHDLLYLNPAGRAMIGIDEEANISRQTLRLAVAEQRLGEIWRSLDRGEAWEGEVEIRSRQAASQTVTLFRAFPVFGRQGIELIAYSVIAVDLTEIHEAEQQRRRFEEQMQHVQRLEGLGVMAGGIAHDFNNLLVGILGNVTLARKQEAVPDAIADHLANIERAADHATNLTAQMLAYSGKASVDLRPVELEKLASDVEPLLRASVPRSCLLELAIEESLPAVGADPTRLRQVLINLVTNAADAVNESERADGRIEVRARLYDEADMQGQSFVLVQPGAAASFVALEVEDNGIGMDEQTREKIFDPFFTTKFTGRGLGLATVYGIVRSHQGAMQVDSEPGRGSLFRIYLPTMQRAEVLPPLHSEEIDSWRSDATVLVVDDEEPVREVARMMLERHGLTVMAAVDGLDGLEVYQREHEQIDVVLLDMMMPRMNGEEAFARLRELRSDLPIILTSGYSESDATGQLSKQRYTYLQKPFTPDELALAVRGELER